MPIPNIITATIQKESPNTEVGLGFKVNSSGQLVVSSVKGSSLFYNTPICEGDRILAINGETDVSNVNDAVAIIAQATDEVNIVATADVIPRGYKLACGRKPENPYDPGIRFGAVRNVLVRVKSIDKDGPFSETFLNVGDICLSVNGIPVSDPRRAINLVKITDSNFTSILFRCGSDFRDNAIQWLINERKGKVSEVEWTSLDECKMKISKHSNPVSLRFLEDYTCEDSKQWEHLADIKKNRKFFFKHYVPFMQKVQEMNKVFCDKKMKALEASMEFANDTVDDPGAGGGILADLQELVGLYNEGMLDFTEFKAAKAKLLGITLRQEPPAVAVALPAAM